MYYVDAILWSDIGYCSSGIIQRLHVQSWSAPVRQTAIVGPLFLLPCNTVLPVMLTFQPRCTCPLQGLWFPMVYLGPIPVSEWSLMCHLTLFLLYHLQRCQPVSSLIRKFHRFEQYRFFKFRLLHVRAVMLPSVLTCVAWTVWNLVLSSHT